MEKLLRKLIKKLRIKRFNRVPSLLLILLILVSLESCNKRFFGFGYDPVAELALVEVDFDYLSTRTKFKYKNVESKTKATADIRIRKDSLIWFRLTNGVGIEGARGVITKDSIQLIDRINKIAYIRSFEELSQELNFEFNYALFQAVLVGELPVDITRDDDIDKQNNDFILTQREGDLTVINKISFKTRRLENLKASTFENDNTLELKYNEFKPLNDKPFAYKAMMILTYFQEGKKEEATIDIEHNRARIEIRPLKFPFNIPDRYERK